MAHFAEIDENNVVLRVLVVNDENENNGEIFLSETLGLGGKWIKTSYNTLAGEHILGGTPFRKNFAGIGFTYDEDRNAFIPPKPFNSWNLNEGTCNWESPIAQPNPIVGKYFMWNEDTLSWDTLDIPAE
jgi:hypothetical protein